MSKPSPFAFTYLVARRPGGGVHATTCDSPPGFGAEFERIMTAQGLIVERLEPDALRAARPNPYRPYIGIPGAPPVSEPEPPPPPAPDWSWIWPGLPVTLALDTPFDPATVDLWSWQAASAQVAASVAARRRVTAGTPWWSADPSGLPQRGQWVHLPRSGIVGQVTGVLTWADGTQAMHVRGPRGEGLARPGGWERAQAPPARASPQMSPVPVLPPAQEPS